MKLTRKTLLLLAFILIAFCSAFACNKVKDDNIQNKPDSLTSNDTIKHDTNLVVIPNDTLPYAVYVGSYAATSSPGIYECRMDRETGKLTIKASAKAENPSYLAIHKNRMLLFAVKENSPGYVSAYHIDTALHTLTLINSQLSKGNSPCFVGVDQTGKYIFVANYSSGSIASFEIKPDGSLSPAISTIQHSGKGPNMNRQEGPHAHMIDQPLVNGLVYASDLGIDMVKAYNIDTLTGMLTNNKNGLSVTAGSGPRHFTFHPNKKFFYSLTELKGTVEVFSYTSDSQELSNIQIISTRESGDTREPGSADIHISPNGKFLYASNRGQINNIAVFSINQETGILTNIGYQSTKGNAPRNFAIDPSGAFLLVANQNSNTIITFKIDQTTGLLSETGNVLTISKPVCIKFW